jgi:hypothetical protein
VLGGIIVLAAGVNRAVHRYNHPATAATAWFLAAGVAVYVGSLVLLRFILGTGPLRLRLIVAGTALVTVVAGLAVSAEAQLAALALVVAAGIVVESFRAPSANSTQ